MKKFMLAFVFTLVATVFTNVAYASDTLEHKVSKIEQVKPDGVNVSVADFNYEVASTPEAINCFMDSAKTKSALKNVSRSNKSIHTLNVFMGRNYIPDLKGKFTFINYKWYGTICSYNKSYRLDKCRTNKIYRNCMKFC